MFFYNIVWISIFALGGISLGILGMGDLNLCTLFLINQKMFNGLISDAESIYFNLSSTRPAYCPLEMRNI